MLLHPTQRGHLILQSQVGRVVGERFGAVEPAVDIESVVGRDEQDGRAHQDRLSDDSSSIVDIVGTACEAAAVDCNIILAYVDTKSKRKSWKNRKTSKVLYFRHF